MAPSDIVNYPFGISVIDTHYYRKQFDASHLIIEKGNAAFVDTGTSLSVSFLIKALTANGLSPENVKYIILTHIHLDHAGGAGTLMKACPRAQLVVHPKGTRHMASPEKLVQATIDVYGAAFFKKLYGEVIPIPEERIITAEDGFSLDFNGRILHFLDTPGHARHHCCIWDPVSKGVFTGDTMGLAYPDLQTDPAKPFFIATTTPVAFEPNEMKHSISRILDLSPDWFYLTHYGPVSVNQQSVKRLVDMIDEVAQLGTEVSDTHELENRLLDLYYNYWIDYSGTTIEKATFKSIVIGDIKLNAQGLLIWAERIKHNAGAR